MARDNTTPGDAKPRAYLRNTLYGALLVLILMAGAYFRFVGIDWGEYTFMHPDERFLLMVGSAIEPVDSFSEYFDTANSSLNPHNRGHAFYVYGTLPLFLARYVVEWVYGHSGEIQMTDVGRPLSALADLVTVLFVFAIAARLYGRRVALLAAAFSAAAVMQIQQSHFFTVDSFITVFTVMAVYFAVRVVTDSRGWRLDSLQAARQQTPAEAGEPPAESTDGEPVVEDGIYTHAFAPSALGRSQFSPQAARFVAHPLFWLSIGFGTALGMAVASKLNAAPVAMMLPAAAAIYLLSLPAGQRQRYAVTLFWYLALAAAVSILVFRIFQPYAFSGPGFFGVRPNPQWVSNIQEQRIQAAGDVDFPPAMQWARRPPWFSFQNMVLWGMGLPFGLLAWAGFLWAGWRILKGEWRRHLLLWGWTAFYFAWQSTQFNPTMRYQLPIYPTLAIFAGWAIVTLYDRGRKTGLSRRDHTQRPGRRVRWSAVLAALIGGAALLGTYAWAYAFSGIYTRPFTRVEASRWIFQNIPGPVNLRIQSDRGLYNQQIAFPYATAIQPGLPYYSGFAAHTSGTLQEIFISQAVDVEAEVGEKTVEVMLMRPGESQPVAAGSVSGSFTLEENQNRDGYLVTLDRPFEVLEGQHYDLLVSLVSGEGAIRLEGTPIANEGDWDDGLPLRLDRYDPFGGIYPAGLNFNMYWADNEEKRERFIRILDQSEYIIISSSRQWASLPRIPERFPLVTTYYRNLLGCPEERTIEWCYNVAGAGDFQGSLGFDLVEVFQADPAVGPVSVNTQFSEEAFTVYDHPKVFVFQKTGSYDPQQVRDILGVVDLSQAIHLTPKKAGSNPADLMLPSERMVEQAQGGTWSELFDVDALQNRFQFLGVVVWYLALAVLGFVAYPLVRMALPGLPDRGYPLARTAGLLLLSYFTWMAGSARIPFSRPTITVVFVILALVGAVLAYLQRDELRREIRERGRYFVMIEALILAFFVFGLMLRIGNPDLWHPHKGGEKPMDFAYFNAVLKSTSFPPYDPWYSGGYLNYYYYGFVLVGVLTKWLALMPSFAYNLILPTVFALIAMGAFSVAWNIYERSGPERSSATGRRRALAGLASASFMVVLGNLGTVRMILHGYQRLAAPGVQLEDFDVFTRVYWTLQGFVEALLGAPLPYALSDWYWIPSRLVPPPDDAIMEFPFFTFLYADPHAHFFAMPVALLALAWAVSVVFGKARWNGLIGAALGFLLGGLAIGALYPINLSDIYTYLPLGLAALGYAIWRYFEPGKAGWLPGLPQSSKRLLALIGALALLALLAGALYKPYSDWYAQGYSSVEAWTGPRTPTSSYLTHWGLFLFIAASWMAWETREWMANTPLSALRRLAPYKGLLQGGLAAVLALTAGLLFMGVHIAWLALPLAAWAGVLLLRPDRSDAARVVLFLIGTALMITIMVELVRVRGDVNRMNTVFKFYLQAWTLLSVSSAAIVGWILAALPRWSFRWRLAWQMPFAALVVSAALFTLLGGTAKVRDRMVPSAPHSLDGMAYMERATYNNMGTDLDLNRDYHAIRWMQANVSGSPVIVEAASGNQYAWFSRYSIYTGLPTVLGWQWHQIQQRTLLPGDRVPSRLADIDDFYTTTDEGSALRFLEKYGVRYVVVGQVERGFYEGLGLDKFERLQGALWDAVYRDRDTVIYEVIR